MTGLGDGAYRRLRVEGVSLVLQAVDIWPRVGEATGDLSRWTTAAASMPVIDAASLPGVPVTASCQAS